MSGAAGVSSLGSSPFHAALLCCIHDRCKYTFNKRALELLRSNRGDINFFCQVLGQVFNTLDTNESHHAFSDERFLLLKRELILTCNGLKPRAPIDFL